VEPVEEWKLNIVSLKDLLEEDNHPWVSVSYCPGSAWWQEMYGPKEITRFVWETREQAYKAKAWIDQFACGGGCQEWHAVEAALPKEKVGQHLLITRRRYERYGGTIPAIYLLPKDVHKKTRREGDELARITHAWPTLTPEVRAQVLRLIEGR
jgi:hypothetical protein